MKNILYLAVDMQNDFMNRDGALYVPGSEEIKNNVKILYNKMSEVATHIFYTMDWHNDYDEELSSTPDFKDTFPPHCMIGTSGSLLIPQATGNDEYTGELMDDKITVFYKNKFSVFSGNRDFLNILSHNFYFDRIYIAGVSGDVCVKHAIDGLIKYKRDGFDFGTLYIVGDCIASLNPNEFNDYITQLTLEYDFIKVINSNDIPVK